VQEKGAAGEHVVQQSPHVVADFCSKHAIEGLVFLHGSLRYHFGFSLLCPITGYLTEADVDVVLIECDGENNCPESAAILTVTPAGTVHATVVQAHLEVSRRSPDLCISLAVQKREMLPDNFFAL